MADPVTMMMVASTAMSVMGGLREGQVAQQTANFNADQAREAAAAKAEQIKQEGERLKGTQIARYGASGVTQEGSPLFMEMDTVRKAKLDELMAIYSGEKQANIMKWKGKQKKIASYFGAGQSILTGASGTMNQYSKSMADKKKFEFEKKSSVPRYGDWSQW